MESLADALEAVEPFVYGLLALATLRRWVRSHHPAAAWAAAMFVLLAVLIGIGRLLPDDPEDVSLWATKALVAALLLFPYMLFRFAATFRSTTRAQELAAGALTIAASGGILLFRDIPDTGEPTTAAWSAYVLLIAVQWVGLSAVVAVWLWRGGAGRPTVVAGRMRVLAAAVSLLAAALLLAAGSSSQESAAVRVVVATLALAACPLFLVGLAPPASLLAAWRRPEEVALRRAEAGLVAATSPDEVARVLLPYVTRALGARAAVLADRNGEIRARHGIDADGAAAIAASVRSDDPDGVVTSISMSSGRLSVVGDRTTPYFGREESEVLARLGALTDVALRRAELTEAERRSAADLQRAHDAMREFVSVASHDLRTPIAVIKGYAGTMTRSWDTLDNDAKLEYLATISRQSEQLSRLVNDMLTMSQLDAGALQPDIDRVELAPIVHAVVDDLGLAEHVCVELSGSGATRADEDHCVRIIRNLIENASHHGAPPIVVTIADDEADGVVLRVRDHGPGVPDELVDRLFERFASGRSGRNADGTRGTGLGLSIVRGLCRASGGDATYEPASPGAAFVVRLPRDTTEEIA